MNEIGFLLCLFIVIICTNAVWKYLTFHVYVNVAQAAVDASRCSMLLAQIDEGAVDVESVTDTQEFDLPFIDLTLQPNWWYEIWLFDFIGRQIVAEYSAAHMQIDWPDFDAA